MAQVLKALTQRFQRHQLNDYPNQVKPAPASETIDTVEGTPSSSSDSEDEQNKPESPVKHAEKRRHLKNTSGSSSSDEELRELYKKSKLNSQFGKQRSFSQLPPLCPRKKIKVLTSSKTTSIGRPCLDFYKMQGSKRLSVVRRPLRIKPSSQHSFCDVQFAPVMQMELPKPLMMDRFKPVVQT